METGVGAGRCRPFWPESELVSVHFYRLRSRSRVANYVLSINDNFGPTIVHLSENIRLCAAGKTRSISMHIGMYGHLKRHVALEIHLMKD